MNPATGEKATEIGGRRYVMKFTWRALAEIEQKYGDSPNLFNADVIASVAAAGLRDRHPEMTADRIMDLSPPLMPFARDVQTALQWAYFGPEAIPKENAVKKNRMAAGLWRRIKTRLPSALRRRNSGA